MDIFLNQRTDQRATDVRPSEFIRIVEEKIDAKLGAKL